ncbi:ferredoxin--NADP reductase [Georgenia ruanii]|uniref:2Fe-2S iron-sulfur cluster binding domain-containing protein n=1 Tax=Georgenia ruanii TaxID=348442 RepID=A0A7J9V0Q6_9MICO|nr:ferredoxin--NADP reductase [Georgenia ruanii]MPV90467.1 2Fe-2S iron-sulfur cluster binding domain-containing protein [Georgenia ruanii]
MNGTEQVGAFARPLKIMRVVEETADTRSLVFDLPDDGDTRFQYSPGQYLTLRIPSTRSGSVARCYSLSSSPHTDRELTITVKRTAEGYGSNWLCDNARPGMQMHVLPPSGRFVPRSFDHDLLLCGAGSGITPLMAIVKSALATGTGNVVLFYANRDESSVIFAEELRRLTCEHPGRLVVLHWLESVQGLPTTAALASAIEPYARKHEAFVCGPAAFMSAMTSALAEAGAPADQVHVEVFHSLEGDPFEEVEIAADHDGASPATAVIELDGSTYEVTWPRSAKLLDVMLNEGIDAPFSCREGSCSSCMCLVSAGETEMILNDILEDEEIEEGMRLACQLLPLSDRVEISYPE